MYPRSNSGNRTSGLGESVEPIANVALSIAGIEIYKFQTVPTITNASRLFRELIVLQGRVVAKIRYMSE